MAVRTKVVNAVSVERRAARPTAGRVKAIKPKAGKGRTNASKVRRGTPTRPHVPIRGINWYAIRPHFEETVKSVSEIAREFGIHRSTLAKNAKKLGWKRLDFTGEAPKDLRERLRLLIETRVTKLEKIMADEDEANVAVGERQAREIGALLRSFEKLKTTPGESLAPRKTTRAGRDEPGEASGGDDDAERWRIEIAQRIARLGKPGND